MSSPFKLFSKLYNLPQVADQAVCEQNSIVLTGGVSGSFDPASILWTQISGPATTITTPTAATTSITGMIPGKHIFFPIASQLFGGWSCNRYSRN